MRRLTVVTAVALMTSTGIALAGENQDQKRDGTMQEMEHMHDMERMEHMQHEEGMKEERAPAREAEAKGTVTAIDTDSGTITLAHEPIPAFNWPSMTMTFRLQDPSMADPLEVNNKVTFKVIQSKSGYTITAIETEKQK